MYQSVSARRNGIETSAYQHKSGVIKYGMAAAEA